MRIISEPDVAAFADRVLPWLLRDPVRNNLPAQLIISHAAGHAPAVDGTQWLSIHADDDLVGVALCTPPHPLLLAEMPQEAVLALADWCAVQRPRMNAANGPVSASDTFSSRWAELTGASAQPAVGSRLFRLDKVDPPVGVRGELRQPEARELELINAWVLEFFHQAAPHESVEGLSEMVDRKFVAERLWVWDDNGPVSMLWTNPWTAGVARISGVYTPTEHRGHGYASGCVAAASQRMFDQGAVACCLFTDLANPTSNKIYQAIGYQPVVDSRLWQFSYPE